jgi:apolipoprotein D and lipocalin family protein
LNTWHQINEAEINMALFTKHPLNKAILAAAFALAGCQSEPLRPIATAPHVDLQRFMGDWYVIGNIPTFLEKNACNAVESYRLDSDGSIATTFTYRADGCDSPEKVMHPRGFVVDRNTNASWGMQFIWPIKAEYKIVHVADDYSATIIGRRKRDYLWIMARTPVIPDAQYQHLLDIAVAQGYDASLVRKVPQHWPGR